MNIRSYQQFQPRLGMRVYIDEAAVVIGNVIIGDDSSIWPAAVIRGDMHSIEIGARTSIQDGCILHVTHDSTYNPGGAGVKIGNEVTVGHKAILHGCQIEDRVLIGMGAIILDNAFLESEVMLAAGSLVPPGKILSSGYLYVGAPVVKKRPLTAEEKTFFKYSAENYVKLKNSYLNK